MNPTQELPRHSVLLGIAPGHLALVVVDGCVVFASDPEEGCSDEFARRAARRIGNKLRLAVREIPLERDELPESWSFGKLAELVSSRARERSAPHQHAAASLASLLLAERPAARQRARSDCRQCPELGKRTCRHCWGRPANSRV